ncbi:unnamed protein product [Oppiella nova]|uniref:C2H2-type domain-containing protein n=1 Tax=Oppiella nova TaxID=334625 RepID=A0A7R9M3U2_9ACAR|nr:unnamed protein product [Oppiella nova]CAG2170243.1 unnamed protein product [Oppiella nova]
MKVKCDFHGNGCQKSMLGVIGRARHHLNKYHIESKFWSIAEAGYDLRTSISVSIDAILNNNSYKDISTHIINALNGCEEGTGCWSKRWNCVVLSRSGGESDICAVDDYFRTFDLLDQLDRHYKTLWDTRDSKGSDGCLQPIKEITLSLKKRKRLRVKTKTHDMNEDMSDSSDDTIDDNCSDISYKPEDINEGKVVQKTKRLNTRSVVSNQPLFATEWELEYHVNCRHFKVFKCQSSGCGKQFKELKALKTHGNRYHRGKCFACNVEGCDYMTNNPSHMRTHMPRHIHGLSFQCTHESCGKRYKSSSALKEHIKIGHTIERPFVCDHKDCGKRYATNTQLTGHKNFRHRKVGVNYFKCPEKGCRFWGRSQQSLDSHASTHNEVRVYRCEWPGCDYTATNYGALNSHRQNNHSAVGVYACDWPGCEYKTSLKRNLCRHKLNHIEYKYVCEWPGCAQRCKTTQSLNKHLMIHSGDKPFACEYEGCGYRSTHKGNVATHMLVHLNAMGKAVKLSCHWPECGKQFIRKMDLKTHLKRHSSKSHSNVRPMAVDSPKDSKV